MKILEQLGIYGWKKQDENLMLASLLTGDPVLLIGTHGSAKTAVAFRMAQALGKRFIAYDASKALFEDVLGFPNVKKLQEGEVEYIPGPVTVWDKEFILIDELNRALVDMQSKWLEIIRSRRIMGFSTKVKWVWAAMNPAGYAGAQPLDEALTGRFALFVYPPEVLSMDEADRVRVAEHMNHDDAPALCEWTGNGRQARSEESQVEQAAMDIQKILKNAASVFQTLREELPSLALFLARFSDLIYRETKGEVALDGRRLGFIYRNILANRAVEIAQAMENREELFDFKAGTRYVVLSSIPVGLNDASVNREETAHKIEVVFDLLSEFFDDGTDISRLNTIYELFTTPDLVRKAEILLKGNIGQMVKTKAWNDLIKGEADITSLAYVALSVEAKRPGTLPSEMIDALGKRIDASRLSSGSIGPLTGESIEFVDDVEAILDQPSDIEKLVAIQEVKQLVEDGEVTSEKLQSLKESVRQKAEALKSLLAA